MQIGNVDVDQLKGLGEKFVGLYKEMAGTVVGNQRLVDEGQAQQDKGSAQLKTLRAEVEAEMARTEASTKEKGQRAAQRSKDKAAA